MARILSADDSSAPAQAVAVWKQGRPVAFATETVYGLGSPVFDAQTVAKIFAIKNRPSFDPLIAHIGSMDMLAQLSSSEHPFLSALIDHFWPGPLTLVLPKRSSVPDIVTAGLPTVGIRFPRLRSAQKLINELGQPVAAPSANPFSYVSPTTAQHVQEQLGDSIDLIIDDGPCAVGLESTILSLACDPPVLLRPGAITAEDLQAVIGIRPEYTRSTDRPQAPGQLTKHYATRTPLQLWEPSQPLPENISRTAFLSISTAPPLEGWVEVKVLSPEGDLNEAAAKLFGALRELDARGYERILALKSAEIGLGLAIMDRLQRCAEK